MVSYKRYIVGAIVLKSRGTPHDTVIDYLTCNLEEFFMSDNNVDATCEV